MIRRIKQWWWIGLAALWMSWPRNGWVETIVLPWPTPSASDQDIRTEPIENSEPTKKDDDDGDSVGRQPQGILDFRFQISDLEDNGWTQKR